MIFGFLLLLLSLFFLLLILLLLLLLLLLLFIVVVIDITIITFVKMKLLFYISRIEKFSLTGNFMKIIILGNT